MHSRIRGFLRAHPKWSCVLAILLVCCGISTHLIQLSCISQAPINSDHFHEVAVVSGKASLGLKFEETTRYVLILGSLGDSSKSFPVRITGTKIDGKLQRRPWNIKPVQFGGREKTSVSFDRHAGAKSATSGFNSRLNLESPPSEYRSFYLHVTDGPLDDAKQYTRVRSRLVESGKTARVYLDRNQPLDSRVSRLCQEIVRLLDEEIVESLRHSLGDVRDVDNDGKLAVLLTPWLGRLQGGKTSLGGFVRCSDFDCDVERPFGNRADVLYLNTNLHPGSHLRDIVAHELTHAVCFGRRSRCGSRLPQEEDWLNEAIAHLSETEWTNLDYRVNRFLEHPNEFPLVVSDYYRAGLWRNHGCRGATFLFLQWCEDAFGEDIRKQLVNNSSQGTVNLEEVTGMSFESLFRYWSIALYRSIDATSLESQTTPEEIPGFDSINLCGALGKWGLAGPRCQPLDIAQLDHTVNLKGTSLAFIELGSSDPGLFDLSLAAQPESSLIVSIMRLRKTSSQIQIDAEWHCGLQEGRNEDSALLLDVTIASRNPHAGLETELIACEQQDGAASESLCLTGKLLSKYRDVPNSAMHRREPVVANPRTELIENNVPRHIRRFRIPLSWAHRGDAPITIKVVIRNHHGIRTAVRVSISSPAKRRFPLRLALNEI